MLERFLDYISEKKLADPEDNILAAVSGGIDSVVLCDLLYKAGMRFAIAHCNFKLRGKDSDEDEKFSEMLAKKYKVPFFFKRFQTSVYAETRKISVQMAARDLRYEWFEEMAAEKGFTKIAVAHHRNDVVETVLMNLVRGTGISGMHGIRAVKKNIIRPLLFAERTEIEKYARTNSLSWREDASNENTKYQRNLIRKEVIPVLKKINPSLETTFINSIEKIEAVENIFLQKIKKTEKKVLKKEDIAIIISLSVLLKESEPLIQLYEIMRPYGFSYHDIKNLLAVKKETSGKIIESSGYVLAKDRDRLVLTKKKKNTEEEFLIGKKDIKLETGDRILEFKIRPVKGIKIPSEKTVACLDADKLVFPLLLRKWKAGDRFHPLGMKASKKLSDFLIDQKVPVNRKDEVMVLVSENKIAWVMGLRPDERFKISPETRKAWVVRVKTK